MYLQLKQRSNEPNTRPSLPDPGRDWSRHMFILSAIWFSENRARPNVHF